MNHPLFFPQIVKSNGFIRLSFPKTVFLIDLREDKIYKNGDYFKTTGKILRPYYAGFMKDENIGIEKKPIWQECFGWFVAQLDVGFDGRLFWKLWVKAEFKKFRGKPYFVCSYWNDKKHRLKKWFEGNLSKPLMVFPKPLQRNLLAYCEVR
jgi:hypothetical protein